MQKKGIKVLVIYLLFLMFCSMLLSLFDINKRVLHIQGSRNDIETNIMLLPTILGGIIALKVLIPLKSLKIFLVIYISLWMLRFTSIYIADAVGGVHLLNKFYRVDLIVTNYYNTVSRLNTPLPFIIYWFVDYMCTRFFQNDVKT